MKKVLFLLVFCVVGFCADAKNRVPEHRTTSEGQMLSLVDRDASRKIEITDAMLSNNGREYPVKQIRCDIVDGVATCKLTFKRLTVFKNCKVVLTTAGGEKMIVDIQK